VNYSVPELLSSTRFLVSWPQTRRIASGPNLVPARHAEPLVNSSSWWEMSVKFARADTFTRVFMVPLCPGYLYGGWSWRASSLKVSVPMEPTLQLQGMVGC